VALNTLNILIADDDECDRGQVRRSLKQAELSCACVEAASIDEALAACDKSAFDCAIVDYRMPGLDGLQGIAALHERFPYMAIIMATGHGDERVATEAMKRGASDYFVKAHMNAESIGRSIRLGVERAALQRKVAQQQEELENFAAVLAHDLSAPIASIQIFAQAIEEELGAQTMDRREVVDCCRELAGVGQRAGALIDMLYEYTQADAQVTFEPVDMREPMQVALSNLSRVIQARGARVTFGELPVVVGNFPQLTQLLQNLIGNGIKYCKAVSPTLHVAASPDRDGAWLFAVKDNGIGIAEEHYRRVFEPFRRLHGVSEYEGTGLGLAICKKIVERHGGIIRCQSNPAEGTTFFFTLAGASGAESPCPPMLEISKVLCRMRDREGAELLQRRE
jgi:signal transduction histidine kinase